jgi:hypothetical protein
MYKPTKKLETNRKIVVKKITIQVIKTKSHSILRIASRLARLRANWRKILRLASKMSIF